MDAEPAGHAEKIWNEEVSPVKVIGITGPTGAGKTTALGALEELGAAVIDCDAV